MSHFFSQSPHKIAISTSLVALIVSPLDAQNDIFSVNLWGFFGSGSALQTEVIQMSPNQNAGAGAWNTNGWQNVYASQRTENISSKNGANATFQISSLRNPGTYKNLRDASTHNNGNATILDGHMNTTQDPGDDSNHGVITITNIPFDGYDLIVYFGQNQGQQLDGKGTLIVNDGAPFNYTLITAEPNGTLTEIVDPTTPGNYRVIRGLSDSSLSIRTYGEGFTHNGPAAIQIAETDIIRQDVDITEVSYNDSTDELTVSWQSFPGDSYSLQWSTDLENFNPIGSPVISATNSGSSTSFGPFNNPAPSADRIFFRVGPPDFDDPILLRTWGVGNQIEIDFSEPILSSIANNPSNFTVTTSSGTPISISSATYGDNEETVRLTTDSPLAPNTTFNVSMSNLTDRSGRPLSNSTPRSFKTFDNTPNGVKVFIFAGQSNMEGFGESELGSGGNGNVGSLRHLVNTEAGKYGSLVNGSGNWQSRSDVKVVWDRSQPADPPNPIKGNLNIGFGTSTQRFGPEYAAGHILGDFYNEPVLIIKTAWGGKSLTSDFRPPSAVANRGGNVGLYYRAMMEYVHNVLDNFDSEFPDWAGQGYQIAGVAWHQGYNDRFEAFTVNEYKDNLADLIRDVRNECGVSNLPFSIATTGHEGFNSSGNPLTLVLNQLAVANPSEFPEFEGNVKASDTRPFWRLGNVSPAPSQGHHWHHNAETYFEIGEVLGNDLLSIINP